MSRRNLQFLNTQQQTSDAAQTDYNAMAWPALMKLARERDLFAKGDKKVDIVAKLQAADAAE